MRAEPSTLPAGEIVPVVRGPPRPEESLTEEADGEVDPQTAALAQRGGRVLRGLVGHQPGVSHALGGLLRRHRDLPHVGPEHGVSLGGGPDSLVDLVEQQAGGVHLL